MAPKDERVQDFLTTRRAKITPEMAGIPRGGGARRVPGLRREATAAGGPPSSAEEQADTMPVSDAKVTDRVMVSR
ncbi:hypothetical protein ACFC4M_36305, partial [Streptomyces sp. NPDC056019]